MLKRAAIAFVLALAPASPVSAQRAVLPHEASWRVLSQSDRQRDGERFDLYVHAGIGGGAGRLASDAIEAATPSVFSIEPAFHRLLLLRAGYRTLVQVEYRRGKGSHSISDAHFDNGRIRRTAIIDMDYAVQEVMLKANILYPVLPRNVALFATVGRGDVGWKDEVEDGFDGTSVILGGDVSFISRSYDVTFGVTHSIIDLSATTLAGRSFPTDVDAVQWLVHISAGIGIGR